MKTPTLKKRLTLSSGDIIPAGTPLEILELGKHSVRVRCSIQDTLENLTAVLEFSLLPEAIDGLPIFGE